MYALDGVAVTVAPHAISAAGADPESLRLLERWFPALVQSL